MAKLILSLLLGSNFLALIAWHIWRDRRGARHNAARCCFPCGCPPDGHAKPISDYKGETYLYCGPCATGHRGLSCASALAAFGGDARSGGDPDAGPESSA